MLEVQLEAPGLCGFSRCRAPLPGPGPKGGRPFAYCPDRAWPGGRTCKQLAAAQDALVEALGAETTPLTDATSGFAEAAERVTEPLREMLAMAEALKTTLADEVRAAAERATLAETEAATERGLRESAELETQQARAGAQAAELAAAETVTEAKADVRRHRTARDQAVAEAKSARESARQAELAKAHAEGIAVTERQRAEEALREVRASQAEITHLRTRADAAESEAAHLQTRAAAADEEMAQLRTRAEAAEIEVGQLRARADAAETEADQLRARAEDAEAEVLHLRTQVDVAETEAAELRSQASQRRVHADKAEAEITRLRQRADAADTAAAQARHDLATRTAELADTADLHADLRAQQRRHAEVTQRLRAALLDPAPDEDLRTRLLTSLLDA